MWNKGEFNSPSSAYLSNGFQSHLGFAKAIWASVFDWLRTVDMVFNNTMARILYMVFTLRVTRKLCLVSSCFLTRTDFLSFTMSVAFRTDKLGFNVQVAPHTTYGFHRQFGSASSTWVSPSTLTFK